MIEATKWNMLQWFISWPNHILGAAVLLACKDNHVAYPCWNILSDLTSGRHLHEMATARRPAKRTLG